MTALSLPSEATAWRALTLWQPWASLVALLVKQIETRSWSTKYRGPLLIHAAAWKITERQTIGAWEAWPPDPPGHVHPNHKNERPARIYCNAGGWPDFGRWRPLPLGAIVATCTLQDVVPIVDGADDHDLEDFLDAYMEGDYPCSAPTTVAGLTLFRERISESCHHDQLPYGDFTPGRYAWLLADIVALPEPIPAKGKQGLWTPDAETVARLVAVDG